MTLVCRNCQKRLIRDRVRIGFCDDDCQHAYAKEHNLPYQQTLPPLLGRASSGSLPKQMIINRKHGKDKRE